MDADVIVIGAGPAGLTAATTAARDAGARVVLVDENERIGGRLPGQLYRHKDTWVIGARTAERLAEEAAEAGVEILSGHQVWSCEPGWRVRLESSRTLTAPKVVVATGAAERPLPMPGWTLPGTLAIGAVQQLVQVQRILPGRRVAVVGTDPLAMTAAEEITLAGGEVVGIFMPSGEPGQHAESSPRKVLHSLSGFASAAPAAWQRLGARMLRNRAIAAAAARLMPPSGIPIGEAKLKVRHRAEAILGAGKVEALRIRKVSAQGVPVGDSREIPVDAVCLSGGLYPLQELTTGNCSLVEVPEVGGLVPLHSPELRTTAPGLYVAGNVTGIEGAAVAERQGALAGTALAADLGAYRDPGARLREAAAQVELARAEAVLTFLPGIFSGRRRLSELWEAHAAPGSQSEGKASDDA
ncbi:NAD(P)/FAD-dependent oxidoreductase [Kocuria coralli]|nr:FAD-dependent oxidoreductase [Kocuria coralli]